MKSKVLLFLFLFGSALSIYSSKGSRITKLRNSPSSGGWNHKDRKWDTSATSPISCTAVRWSAPVVNVSRDMI